eukprot:4611649-Alexandrium_andersonii.AAC.1
MKGRQSRRARFRLRCATCGKGPLRRREVVAGPPAGRRGSGRASARLLGEDQPTGWGSTPRLAPGGGLPHPRTPAPPTKKACW